MTGVGDRDAAFRDQWHQQRERQQQQRQQRQEHNEEERAALLLLQEQGGAGNEAVDAMASVTADSQQWAWLYPGPPSVVGRPEVVLEGLIPGTGRFGVPEKWVEIPFLYKPSDPMGGLPWVAPHQPRLDWQMWFAALSAYQNEPWFVHLAAKLLTTTTSSIDIRSAHSSSSSSSTNSKRSDSIGTDKSSARGGSPCPSVLDLLDAANYPFNASTGPPAAIRASRYTYDYTRLNTPWAQHQPNPSLVSTPPWIEKIRNFVESMLNDIYHTDANGDVASAADEALAPMQRSHSVDEGTSRSRDRSRSMFQSPPSSMATSSSALWARRYVGSYLPAISLSDPSLNAFLAHHGFPNAERGCAQPNLSERTEACTGVPAPSVGSSGSGGENSIAESWTEAGGGREKVCNAIVSGVTRARLLKHRPGYEWRVAAGVMAMLVLLRARESKSVY